MARRTVRVATLTALAAVAFTASAFAHAGNPKFESLINGVTPSIEGFSVVVLSGDDRLEVVNKSSETITIDGYNKEPYLRMAPDGTVSVNVRSPAYYLNDDRSATSAVPAIADEKAAPRWKVVARDGRFQFHDHRIHWMTNADPPQVTDASARTKVVDWKVPLHAGGTDGAIAGTLFWRGSGGGPPAGAFVALALLALLGAAAVVVVRRRRSTGGDAATGGGPGEEAW
jgi:hypothetical protein